MGVGRITEAREVTQGVVHAAHGGAGDAAQRIAAIGARAGREAQRTVAAGLGDAAKNIGDTLKVVGDFAVKALWEKPIAEAEEKLRELDLECRSKGWRDENGVERPGFDLVRGAEAANIGEQWDAYMSRKAKEFTKNLTAGQREELSRRTAKFRTETRARLTERGAVEAITSNLADVDARAMLSGERNVAEAVARADEAAEKERVAAEIGGLERYGKRNDGTAKGRGYFGEIVLPNGGIATEYSVGVELDGKETEIPTLVPTLTKDELKMMVEDIIPNGKKVPDEIVKKAAEHAKTRIGKGLSPFASNLEAVDQAAAVSMSDALVEKREKLIRDKVIGGLGRKSEEVATAEADRIVRAEALETVKALAAAGHYDRARKLVEQGGKLGFDDAALAKGREIVDGMEANAAVNEANVAISTIRDTDGNYPAGRVETIERSITTLKRVGAAQKKDSKLAASAAEAVAKLDKHADTIRVGEFFDGFDQSQIGRLDLEKAKNPYKKGTRDARCWDEAKKSWLKEETEEYRRNRTEVLGMSGTLAEESVAEGSPQAYLEWLDRQVEAGRLMPSDRKTEKRKFMNGWMKSPEMQQRAAAMLRAVKDKLNIDFGAAIKKDEAGLPELSKSGLLQVEKGATLPEIGYERMERLGLPKLFGLEPNDRIVRRERFSGADFKAIMDYSLQFAIADGLNVPVGNIPDDLQWLVSDEDRKKGSHRVSCVNDFRAFLDRLSQRDKVLGAKEEFSSATKKLYLERAMH